MTTVTIFDPALIAVQFISLYSPAVDGKVALRRVGLYQNYTCE